MDISEECSAFALYGGVPGETSAIRFYSLISKWHEDLGLIPDVLSIIRPGRHGPDDLDPYRGPSGPFRRVAPRLFKAGFSRITGFQIITTIPGVERNPLLNILVAGFWFGGTDAIVVARSSVATLESSSMLRLAAALIHSLEPEYGIGYTRDDSLMPAFYGMGVSVSPPIDDPFTDKREAEEAEDEESGSGWYLTGRPKRVYCEGFLRDVYPWNFLNHTQLSWKVGGQSLEQWIRQDKGRGALTPISNTLTLWKVPESAREGIRAFLGNYGMLFIANPDD